MRDLWNAILAWFSAEERLVGNKLAKMKGAAQADCDWAIDKAHVELGQAEAKMQDLATYELEKLETLVDAARRRLLSLEQAGVVTEVEVHDRLQALIAKVA